MRDTMYDRTTARYPHYIYSDESGSESHPLVSSDASHSSRRSFGTVTWVFPPDSETSDVDSAPKSTRPQQQQQQHSTAASRHLARRPYQHHHTSKLESSWEDQMSSMAYSRFQCRPNQQRMYSVDESALSSFVFYIPFISGQQHSVDGKQSSIVTIFAIWNTVLGTSLLTMPWGVERSGLLAGLVTIVLMGAVSLYTAYRILQVQDKRGVPGGEVAQLTDTLLGEYAALAAKIISMVVLTGAVITYWILMTNFLFHSVNFFYGLATSRINEHLPPVICLMANSTQEASSANSTALFEQIWQQPPTVPILLILFICPLVNFRSVVFFTKFNSLGTLSVLYIFIFVMVKAVIWGVNVEVVTDKESEHYTPLFQITFPVLSGMAALSYFIHNIVISVMRNNRYQENNYRDLCVAYLLVIFTYVSIGVVFYVTFPLRKECIADNMLNNFPNWDLMTLIARVFLFFQLITVYPLIAFMLHSQFFLNFGSQLGMDPTRPKFLHIFSFNAFVILICVLFAIFLPRIGTILRYTGAICGLLYIFTLPIVLHLATLKDEGKLSAGSVIIHMFIPLLGLLNLVAQFLM